MITLDASAGGQIFRNSIAFSALLGKPVKLTHIRASRPSPGLKAQHLTALNTLSTICQAGVTGNRLSSQEITFIPKEVKASKLKVNIGTAGAIPLLLQSLLLPALLKKIELRMEGGTDVPFAPPATYLQQVLLPQLHKMKARYALKLIARGYYPRGAGVMSFASRPVPLPLRAITLTAFGNPSKITISSHSASLPAEVSRNQLKAARKTLLPLDVDMEDQLQYRESAATIGSGIDLIAETSTGALLGTNALGKKGKWADRVGKEAAEQMLSLLEAKQPVDVHLADQLIPFMALAKGKSEIHCTSLSEHTLNSIKVAEAFCDVSFEVQGTEGEPAVIAVKGCAFKP